MQLNRIDDPRDALAKARRSELVKYARANNVPIDPDMPAILMRDILRQRGLTRPPIPNRPLGSQMQNGRPTDQPAAAQPQKGIEADATADLAAQWARDRQRDLDTGKTKRPERHNPMAELRLKARELHIKVDRRDNVKTLRAKIEARSGKNAPQQLQ